MKNSSESISIKRPIISNNDSINNFAWINLETVSYNDDDPWPNNTDGYGYALQRLNSETFGNIVSNWTSVYKGLPFANAGENIRVRINQSTFLDGDKSKDPENLNLSYNWLLVSSPDGSNANLEDSNSMYPKITPDSEGNYIFTLQVNNGNITSLPSKVSIYAYNNSSPEVRSRSLIRTLRITINETVLIDGSLCFDPDYEEINFNWNVINRPDDSNYETPVNVNSFIFKPDKAGTYDIELVTDDNELFSNSISFKVLVSPSTGLDDELTNHFNLYPNPVHNKMIISLNTTPVSDVNLILSDMSGQVIFRNQYDILETSNNGIQLNLEEIRITQGFYFVKIQTNNFIETKKIMYLKQ